MGGQRFWIYELPSVWKQQEHKVESLQVAAEPTNKPETSPSMLMRPLKRNYSDVLAQMRLECPVFLSFETAELGF